MFISEKTRDRIEEDLRLSEAMATTMSAYLDSTAVYYPLATTTFPRLTLGNFLMRRHRLLALQDELSDIDKGRLEKVIFNFNQAVNQRITRIEQKGAQEAGIRLRQWEQAVRELQETPASAIPYYPTAVENRVMLAALLAYLQQAPYRLDEQLMADTAVADQHLKAIWQAGDFIWPPVWQAAYPADEYWWLYGRPMA